MRPALGLWSAPPAHPVLQADEVHLWRFRLDLPHADVDRLKQFLSTDELARAARLLDPTKRHSFIAARGRLRQILSLYLTQPPATLQFAYGANGKPSLATATQPLFFNLSHAGNWGLLGLCANGEVGVDIEQIEPALDYRQMAQRYFSPAEQAVLEKTAPTRTLRCFYRLWTSKEARFKAIGSGFSISRIPAPNPYFVGYFPIDRHYLGAVFSYTYIQKLHRLNFPGDDVK